MRFTSMFRYGLRAMAVLADNYGKGPVSAKQISSLENLSPSFTEQLLAHLRRGKLVSGVRGPGGGFALNRDPEEILLSEVVEALEGPFFVSTCLGADDSAGIEQCEKYETCCVLPMLRLLEKGIREVFDSYRLSDLKDLSCGKNISGGKHRGSE